MDDLFSDPRRLIALLCIIGLVLGVNAPILFGLAGRKSFKKEAEMWGKVVRPGADIRQRDDAQRAELHQRVQHLKEQSVDEEKPKDD